MRPVISPAAAALAAAWRDGPTAATLVQPLRLQGSPEATCFPKGHLLNSDCGDSRANAVLRRWGCGTGSDQRDGFGRGRQGLGAVDVAALGAAAAGRCGDLSLSTTVPFTITQPHAQPHEMPRKCIGRQQRGGGVTPSVCARVGKGVNRGSNLPLISGRLLRRARAVQLLGQSSVRSAAEAPCPAPGASGCPVSEQRRRQSGHSGQK